MSKKSKRPIFAHKIAKMWISQKMSRPLFVLLFWCVFGWFRICTAGRHSDIRYSGYCMYHATQQKGAEYKGKRKANFFHQDDNEWMHVVNLANVLIINWRRRKNQPEEYSHVRILFIGGHRYFEPLKVTNVQNVTL